VNNGPQPQPLTAADLKPIINGIDALVALVARAQPKRERATLTDRIRLLHDLGIDNVRIATAVGRGSNYVGAVLGRGKSPGPGAKTKAKPTTRKATAGKGTHAQRSRRRSARA
jgi:hypothetical protein